MAGIVTKVCKSWGRNVPLLARQAAPFGGSVRYTNVDASRGVGPTKGPENDPATKGSTPDDSRADSVHMFEPKEITKEKVAKAQEEPAGLQGSKLMPGFDAPVNKDAKPQSTTVDTNQRMKNAIESDAERTRISTNLPINVSGVENIEAIAANLVDITHFSSSPPSNG